MSNHFMNNNNNNINNNIIFERVNYSHAQYQSHIQYQYQNNNNNNDIPSSTNITPLMEPMIIKDLSPVLSPISTSPGSTSPIQINPSIIICKSNEKSYKLPPPSPYVHNLTKQPFSISNLNTCPTSPPNKKMVPGLVSSVPSDYTPIRLNPTPNKSPMIYSQYINEIPTGKPAPTQPSQLISKASYSPVAFRSVTPTASNHPPNKRQTSFLSPLSPNTNNTTTTTTTTTTTIQKLPFSLPFQSLQRPQSNPNGLNLALNSSQENSLQLVLSNTTSNNSCNSSSSNSPPQSPNELNFKVNNNNKNNNNNNNNNNFSPPPLQYLPQSQFSTPNMISQQYSQPNQLISRPISNNNYSNYPPMNSTNDFFISPTEITTITYDKLFTNQNNIIWKIDKRLIDENNFHFTHSNLSMDDQPIPPPPPINMNNNNNDDNDDDDIDIDIISIENPKPSKTLLQQLRENINYKAGVENHIYKENYVENHTYEQMELEELEDDIKNRIRIKLPQSLSILFGVGEDFPNSDKKSRVKHLIKLRNGNQPVLAEVSPSSGYTMGHGKDVRKSAVKLLYKFPNNKKLIDGKDRPKPIKGSKAPYLNIENSLISKARLKRLKDSGGVDDPNQHLIKKPPLKRGRGRPVKDKPRFCEICATENSPEWRRGPRFVVNICNACGLQHVKFSKKEEIYLKRKSLQMFLSIQNSRLAIINHDQIFDRDYAHWLTQIQTIMEHSDDNNSNEIGVIGLND